MEESEDWYKEPDRQEFTKQPVSPSWLGVPIMLGNEVQGVIAVYHPDKGYVYSSDDLFTLQAIANQAAIGLENAHQYYDIQPKLRALVEFAENITSKIRLTTPQILEQIHVDAGKFLDVDNMYVALCTKDTSDKDIVHFELVYRNGNIEEWEDRPINVGRTGEIIRSKKPLLLPTRDDMQEWFREHPGDSEKDGSVSWLGVPMIIAEEVIGVIGVNDFEQEKSYSAHDLEILQALAKLAAIALENSRLYGEAREEIVAQRQLAAVGGAMTALEHQIGNTLSLIPRT